jgi:hypothetical protein
VNRREYSQKRKAESGAEFNRKNPELVNDLNDEKAKLMDIIKKAMQEKYPRKYERLIKAYFRSLQNDDAAFE